MEHDEYSILKRQIREMWDKYHTTFGVNISYCSDGTVSIYSSEDDSKEREITIEECKQLLSKYDELASFIEICGGSRFSQE